MRPWGLLVPSPGEVEPLLLSPDMIYQAAQNGEFGLRIMGVFSVHEMN